jgi:hypothetical protein
MREVPLSCFSLQSAQRLGSLIWNSIIVVSATSLLVLPILVGSRSDRLLAHLDMGSWNANLLSAYEDFDKGLVLLRYEVLRVSV